MTDEKWISQTERTIAAAYGVPVQVVVAPRQFYYSTIMAEEIRAVAKATEHRRREFAAGRACARRAIEQLGYAVSAIPAGNDRAPLWPAHVVGSITHCTDFCCAVIADSRSIRSIGIDAEVRGSVGVELSDIISSETERASWSSIRVSRSDARAICFSAKETVYKAYYPIAKKFLDFQDVSIELSGDEKSGTFRPNLLKEESDGHHVFDNMRGFWIIDQCNVYSGVSLLR